MQSTLQLHGKDWCERLAERIYEISVDTFSQSVMPSLHTAGWLRRHLVWEFKLNDGESEPDRTLVDEDDQRLQSFLRSSVVHRLFIQELVQGTFAEAKTTPRVHALQLVVKDLVACLSCTERLVERLAYASPRHRKGGLHGRLAADPSRLGVPQAALRSLVDGR